MDARSQPGEATSSPTPSIESPSVQIQMEAKETNPSAAPASTRSIFDRVCCIHKETRDKIYKRFFPLSEKNKSRFTFFHQTVLGINLVDKTDTMTGAIKNGVVIAGQIGVSAFIARLAYISETNPTLAVFLALLAFASTSKTLGTLVRSATFIEEQEAKQIKVDHLINQLADAFPALKTEFATQLHNNVEDTHAQVSALRATVMALKARVFPSPHTEEGAQLVDLEAENGAERTYRPY